MLVPYVLHILGRWDEGCRNGMKLSREVRERGYSHGASNVGRLVAQLRRNEGVGHRSGPRRAKAAPSTRHDAAGLEKTPAAVEAGLTQRRNNGPVEGFVHKLKLVKRRGYGRANSDLLCTLR